MRPREIGVWLALALSAITAASTARSPVSARASTVELRALPISCFSPGTKPEVIERYARQQDRLRSSLSGPSFQFLDSNRWDTTATDGPGLVQGQVTTLTWNIVPDGTPILATGGHPAETNAPSDLKAFLTGIYGSEAAWMQHFQTVFDRWGAITGVTYVKVNYDDMATLANGGVFPFNPGILNVRADVRIGGHFIDGFDPVNGSVLGYDYFPEIGDMVLDTGDGYYAQPGGGLQNGSLGLRNIIAHEHGHGLGLSHSCPVNKTKLMEPIVTTLFTHAQLDDKLAGWRGYGDDREDNETAATASNLGALPNGTTTVSDLSTDSNTDVDFYKFTVPAGKKAAVTVTPIGSTYLAGPQNPDGSCSAGSNFNALAVNDLAVELRGTNGTTILASANAFGAGVAENIPPTALGGAGTFFIRAFVPPAGAVNNVQGYQLSVTITDDPPLISINDVSVIEGDAGTSLATFTVSLSIPAVTPVGVNWATADGTATTAGGDYVANSGSLSFTAGQQTKQVSVTINGDQLFEPNETFFVNLSAPTGAVIADGQGQGTITNDDTQMPIVTTGAGSLATDSTMTLNGTINPNGLVTNGSFQYGTTIAYGNTSATTNVGSGMASVAIPIPIDGLTCNTTYHFRAVGTNSAGTRFGADSTFSTSVFCPPPPAVTTSAATGFTQTGGTLNGSINPNGGVTNRRFEWGLTAAYGSIGPNLAIGSGNAGVGVSYVVTGLACNTLYHYRAVGQNGGGIGNGGDLTFTTAACPPAGSNNISALTAQALPLNSMSQDSMSNVRAETWYRVRLFASRSYQVSAWPVDHEQGMDAPALDLGIFSDDAGITPASPAPLLSSGDLEGSTNGNGDALPVSMLFQPTATGVYKVRILRISGGTVTHSINVAVRETTLFSPWTSKAAGFEGFVEMHNNTNATISVTLRAYDSSGTLQGAGLTLTLQPNATDFRTAAQIGVPVNVFAGIVLTHNGAFGAVTANITTLNGANGLSFDSPFTARRGELQGLSIR